MKQKINRLNSLPVKWAGCLLLAGLFYANPVSAYERIVSATGNASEIIAELGLADKLVAVDTTSTLPADVMAKKPKIGYRRRLSSEGILSMWPDLLILAPDAGPPAVVNQLKAADVETITIADVKTVDGVIADIKMIADILDASKAARPMIERIRSDEKVIKQLVADYPRPPKMVFLMDGGGGPDRLMALGNNSAGNAVISLVGGENMFADDFDSLKPVSLESLVAGDADMIVIASHNKDNPYPAALTKALDRYKSLALTKAGKKQCVFTIGTVESLGFGPGFTQAAKSIAEAAKACLNNLANQ
ncbi:MAG: hemin ABC transporter [Gammaproteobacteria bacterium]|nr:MAG: hemin ABC transporter [Gammaproteobacteria bacterium]